MNNPDWTILTEDLRDTVEWYLQVSQMQSMVGPFGGPSNYTIADYDEAVRSRNTDKFLSILKDAWLRAPESRSVYSDSGFVLLCNICDGSEGNFLSDIDEEENADED